ncbi:MAG: hypothetical protein WDW38_005117 [Sanguina aurantia]
MDLGYLSQELFLSPGSTLNISNVQLNNTLLSAPISGALLTLSFFNTSYAGGGFLNLSDVTLLTSKDSVTLLASAVTKWPTDGVQTGITPSGTQWVYFDTCASPTMLATAVNVTHAAVEHVHDLISPTTGADFLTKLAASQAAFRESVVIFTPTSAWPAATSRRGVLVNSEMHFMGSPAGQLVGLDMGMQVSFMRLQNNLSVVYITDLQLENLALGDLETTLSAPGKLMWDTRPVWAFNYLRIYQQVDLRRVTLSVQLLEVQFVTYWSILFESPSQYLRQSAGFLLLNYLTMMVSHVGNNSVLFSSLVSKSVYSLDLNLISANTIFKTLPLPPSLTPIVPLDASSVPPFLRTAQNTAEFEAGILVSQVDTNRTTLILLLWSCNSTTPSLTNTATISSGIIISSSSGSGGSSSSGSSSSSSGSVYQNGTATTSAGVAGSAAPSAASALLLATPGLQMWPSGSPVISSPVTVTGQPEADACVSMLDPTAGLVMEDVTGKLTLQQRRSLSPPPRSRFCRRSSTLLYLQDVEIHLPQVSLPSSFWLQGLGLMGVDVTLRRGPPSRQILPQLLVSGILQTSSSSTVEAPFTAAWQVALLAAGCVLAAAALLSLALAHVMVRSSRAGAPSQGGEGELPAGKGWHWAAVRLQPWTEGGGAEGEGRVRWRGWSLQIMRPRQHGRSDAGPASRFLEALHIFWPHAKHDGGPTTHIPVSSRTGSSVSGSTPRTAQDHAPAGTIRDPTRTHTDSILTPPPHALSEPLPASPTSQPQRTPTQAQEGLLLPLPLLPLPLLPLPQLSPPPAQPPADTRALFVRQMEAQLTHDLVASATRHADAAAATAAAAPGGGGGGAAAAAARLREPISSVQLLECLGCGSYGRVYKARWRGSLVAVKSLVLPASLSGAEKRQQMAIMETAISTCLSHPNIVQTYTYMVQPVHEDAAAEESHFGGLADRSPHLPKSSSSSSSSHSSSSTASQADPSLAVSAWEVLLVFELCDRGSLRTALDAGLFNPAAQHAAAADVALARTAGTGAAGGGQGAAAAAATGSPGDTHSQQHSTPAVDYAGVLSTALDVARGLTHLHAESILHGDLKASNILLKSSLGDNRGFIAKVSDFGLSTKIDASATHISMKAGGQGTLTHLAPEALLEGTLSRASDVYAYGILMWELYTGRMAFLGVPPALLGHEVAAAGLRPSFPASCPLAYQLLACRCWESDVDIRPTFEEVLLELQRLWQSHQGGAAATTSVKTLQPPATAQLLQALYPGNDMGAAWQVGATTLLTSPLHSTINATEGATGSSAHHASRAQAAAAAARQASSSTPPTPPPSQQQRRVAHQLVQQQPQSRHPLAQQQQQQQQQAIPALSTHAEVSITVAMERCEDSNQPWAQTSPSLVLDHSSQQGPPVEASIDMSCYRSACDANLDASLPSTSAPEAQAAPTPKLKPSTAWLGGWILPQNLWPTKRQKLCLVPQLPLPLLGLLLLGLLLQGLLLHQQVMLLQLQQVFLLPRGPQLHPQLLPFSWDSSCRAQAGRDQRRPGEFRVSCAGADQGCQLLDASGPFCSAMSNHAA